MKLFVEMWEDYEDFYQDEEADEGFDITDSSGFKRVEEFMEKNPDGAVVIINKQ
jgi:hypothetical protein